MPSRCRAPGHALFLQADPRTTGADTIQGRNKHTRILVVDDSPAILALMRDLLKARGYINVMTAATSEEATKLAGEHRPEVVFLDLMMPDVSGIELTRQIMEMNPHTHIVLTTALPASHESVVMAVSQGAEDYLPKPLRPEALATVLSHVTKDSVADDVGYG